MHTVCVYIYITCIHTHLFLSSICDYGVATISRLLKMIRLFCRISSLLYGSFAKETYNFKEPTSHSHPIPRTFAYIRTRKDVWSCACGFAHSLIMELIENMVYCTCRVMHVLVRMHDYGCMHVGVQLHVQLHMDTYRYAEG